LFFFPKTLKQNFLSGCKELFVCKWDLVTWSDLSEQAAHTL